MSSNLQLTEQQRTLGEFYKWLHQHAEYLRQQRREAEAARQQQARPEGHQTIQSGSLNS